MIGRTLGPYEITEQLGAGGMGEVYLAQDTRLGRQVAIKVLPGEFASDPGRLARFEQEARAAAALNHPHIATVHDVGVHEGIHYMVQEYLRGQPLRAAIEKGALPLKKAVALGVEIAEALRAAHRAGIVHRDLKPENVFITGDGHAKVLDFGLAKLTEIARGPLSSQSMSPTVLGTQAGTVMGTAGYMAPEQVRGDDVDHRADLFAFGCVLWEMVTGKRAFAGKSVPHTLHMILDEAPAGSETEAAEIPLRLRWLLDKALAKSPDARTQSAADLVVDLRQLARELESGIAITGPGIAPPAPSDSREVGLTGLPLKIAVPAATLLLVLGAAAAWLALWPDNPPPAHPVRFTVGLPDGEVDFDNQNHQVLAISPDGTTIAMVAAEQIWLRRLDALEPTSLGKTTEPRAPTFSPDGQQIAFWDENRIKRIGINGGAAVVVGACDGRPNGISWADDGFIYVGDPRGQTIWRLPEAGGQPETVVEVADETLTAYGPRLLPGGDWLIFTLATFDDWDGARIVAHSLSTQEQRVLVEGGHDAWVSPTGHLAYVTGGVLLGLPFNADTVSVGRGAVPLLEGVRSSFNRFTGAAFYGLSDNGTLAFVRRTRGDGDVFALSWVDRTGRAERLPIETASMTNMVSLSPDGRSVAVPIHEGEGSQIWIYSVDRAGGQRLTTSGDNDEPVWSPDGQWVYYVRVGEGEIDIWRRRADLSSPEEPVVEAEGEQWPTSISRDGKWLYYGTATAQTSNIARVSLETDRAEPEIIVGDGVSGFDGARISPDGRFLAFVSDETGRDEIIVLEVATSRRWRISEDGGRYAAWSPRGDELFYINPVATYSVAITTDPEFAAGIPQQMFLHVANSWETSLSVTPDGERFLFRVQGSADADPVTPHVDIVLNWFEELKERVPSER